MTTIGHSAPASDVLPAIGDNDRTEAPGSSLQRDLRVLERDLRLLQRTDGSTADRESVQRVLDALPLETQPCNPPLAGLPHLLSIMLPGACALGVAWMGDTGPIGLAFAILGGGLLAWSWMRDRAIHAQSPNPASLVGLAALLMLGSFLGLMLRNADIEAALSLGYLLRPASLIGGLAVAALSLLPELLRPRAGGPSSDALQRLHILRSLALLAVVSGCEP